MAFAACLSALARTVQHTHRAVEAFVQVIVSPNQQNADCLADAKGKCETKDDEKLESRDKKTSDTRRCPDSRFLDAFQTRRSKLSTYSLWELRRHGFLCLGRVASREKGKLIAWPAGNLKRKIQKAFADPG